MSLRDFLARPAPEPGLEAGPGGAEAPEIRVEATDLGATRRRRRRCGARLDIDIPAAAAAELRAAAAPAGPGPAPPADRPGGPLAAPGNEEADETVEEAALLEALLRW
eukprot:tig00021314_g20131.t1